jgi:hypothetical protein
MVSIDTDDKSQYDRFSLTLPESLNQWLYQFTIEIKKNGGYRVPKTLVLRAFIRAIMDSGIRFDLKNIRNEGKGGPIAGKVSSLKLENILVERIKSALLDNNKKS